MEKLEKLKELFQPVFDELEVMLYEMTCKSSFCGCLQTSSDNDCLNVCADIS